MLLKLLTITFILISLLQYVRIKRLKGQIRALEYYINYSTKELREIKEKLKVKKNTLLN